MPYIIFIMFGHILKNLLEVKMADSITEYFFNTRQVQIVSNASNKHPL